MSTRRRWMAGKAAEWGRRYAPLELVGTMAALTVAVLAQRLTHQLSSAALAGALAETAGYYSTAMLFELRRQRRARRGGRMRLALRSLRDLVVEFGPAEAVDTAFVRPMSMFAGASLMGSLIPGLLAGKLFSDIVFYAFAVASYELRGRVTRAADDLEPRVDESLRAAS